MIVAGVGCRKGVSPEAVIAALEQASAEHSVAFDFIVTAPMKADEPALLEAATRLGMAFVVVAQADFDAAAVRTLTRSALSSKHAASPSVSEASALAALGEASRLIAPRMVVGDITVAFATAGDKT
ncbi:cobalamin biosynthesis protein [Agrobacterium larrymoorei]|uniref:Cobalt-precorrin 5A hydrolase n=1 Tax=Agrobacterium larrymoorei TaxID=160699 RepID=A0ABU0UR26_9HYPH|nr:cobalamin biosynthesis protein [Agrobacterium larrymoorei]MDQ1187410.1 cobalt-precorrin 5A hydrolase [Agrobacterium larrymoorei]